MENKPNYQSHLDHQDTINFKRPHRYNHLFDGEPKHRKVEINKTTTLKTNAGCEISKQSGNIFICSIVFIHLFDI